MSGNEPENNLMQRKIHITELPSEIPNFEASYEPKDSLIKKWIISWILSAVKAEKIKENDILPAKSEISSYLGVSSGTVQNAIRYIEDEGYLKSKQKIGTMISNVSNPSAAFQKGSSRREKAVYAVKKAILMNNYKVGKPVPSTRKMSEYIGIPQNTTRLAYEYLCSSGILESLQMRGNDSNWYLKKLPEMSAAELKQIDNLEADTLVDKLTDELQNYLAKDFKPGDKIPPHKVLAEKLQVSIKTVNDCIQRLNKKGIIITRRGRYGSMLAQNPISPVFETPKENSIFAKAKDAQFYIYQKIETKLKEYIIKNMHAGDKMPSLYEFSKMFNVSTNTIRKAFMPLEEQGVIGFTRGRFGGTYVIQMPETSENNTYQWLSINQDIQHNI